LYANDELSAKSRISMGDVENRSGMGAATSNFQTLISDAHVLKEMASRVGLESTRKRIINHL
jgi:hypothetical protein